MAPVNSAKTAFVFPALSKKPRHFAKPVALTKIAKAVCVLPPIMDVSVHRIAAQETSAHRDIPVESCMQGCRDNAFLLLVSALEPVCTLRIAARARSVTKAFVLPEKAQQQGNPVTSFPVNQG